MPHVLLSEINKLSMLRALESGRYLSMTFRSWDLYEFPLLQSTTKHLWAIKNSYSVQEVAIQIGRKNVMSEDISRFDNCKLTNVKLYLNSEFPVQNYPYDDLNLETKTDVRFCMYFCKGYYGYEYLEPNLTFTTFLRNGLFVIIDCSRQNESVKSGRTIRL